MNQLFFKSTAPAMVAFPPDVADKSSGFFSADHRGRKGPLFYAKKIKSGTMAGQFGLIKQQGPNRNQLSP